MAELNEIDSQEALQWASAIKASSMLEDLHVIRPEYDFTFYHSAPLSLDMITFMANAWRREDTSRHRPPTQQINAHLEWPLNWIDLLVNSLNLRRMNLEQLPFDFRNFRRKKLSMAEVAEQIRTAVTGKRL